MSLVSSSPRGVPKQLSAVPLQLPCPCLLPRLIKHTKKLMDKEEKLCIKVLQTLQEMLDKKENFDELVSPGTLKGESFKSFKWEIPMFVSPIGCTFKLNLVLTLCVFCQATWISNEKCSEKEGCVDVENFRCLHWYWTSKAAMNFWD